MSLPSRLRVGAYDYTIEEMPHELANAKQRFGECDCNTKRISLDTHYGLRKTAVTLLHELLHAVHTEVGLEDGDPEERVVCALANGLAQVWRDNPAAMAWLTAALADDVERDR